MATVPEATRGKFGDSGARPIINSKVEMDADLAIVAGHVVSSCERSLKRSGFLKISIVYRSTTDR
jgi:hypothetical protein